MQRSQCRMNSNCATSAWIGLIAAAGPPWSVTGLLSGGSAGVKAVRKLLGRSRCRLASWPTPRARDRPARTRRRRRNCGSRCSARGPCTSGDASCSASTQLSTSISVPLTGCHCRMINAFSPGPDWVSMNDRFGKIVPTKTRRCSASSSARARACSRRAAAGRANASGRRPRAAPAQIGQRAAVALVGHDLEAVVGRRREAGARGAHRVERQRPDVGGQDVLAVADEVQRADLPVRLGAPAMRRREHLHAARRARRGMDRCTSGSRRDSRLADDILVPAAEDQPLWTLHTRHAHQAPAGEIEVLREEACRTSW